MKSSSVSFVTFFWLLPRLFSDLTMAVSSTSTAGLGLIGHGNLGVPVLLLVMLGMLVLPVSPFLLDVSFSFNIALAIVVLLVAVYALRPLDFAVFPTILLVATTASCKYGVQ